MPRRFDQIYGAEVLMDVTTDRWEDLRFPAQGINPLGSPSPASLDDTTVPGTLLFAGNATNVIAGVAQMPHGWKEGSAIYPHIHWTKTTADGTNKYPIAWQFKYAVVGMASVVPAYSAWQNSTLVLGDLETAEKHNLSTFPAITMTGQELSCMVLWQIQRLHTSDDYADPCRLLEVDFHYQIDSVGSESVGYKQ